MKKNLKIAYVVLCHDEPELLRRTALALNYADDKIFVHVDNKRDISDFYSSTTDLKNICFIENREDIYWGGFNSVVATIKLFRRVIEDDIHYDRIVLLQGKDYPLHSPHYIHNFFAERSNEEFCKAKNITVSYNPKEYMQCCGCWIMDGKNTLPKRILRKVFSIMNTKLKVKYRKGYFSFKGQKWDVYKGWAQIALTRECVEHIIRVYDEMPKYNKFIKYRFPPDEIYFHTIVHNSSFKNKISEYSLTPRKGNEWFSENLNLTYFEYPTTVTVFTKASDCVDLLKTNALFIRKVTSSSSTELLDELDKNILRENYEHKT